MLLKPAVGLPEYDQFRIKKDAGPPQVQQGTKLEKVAGICGDIVSATRPRAGFRGKSTINRIEAHR
jgi:hypothetical protein